MQTVKAKTFCGNFDEQLDIAETLYGKKLMFFFSESDMEEIVMSSELYSERIKERVLQLLRWQKRKYAYLFCPA